MVAHLLPRGFETELEAVLVVEVDGVPVQVQVGMNLTAIGSKPEA